MEQFNAFQRKKQHKNTNHDSEDGPEFRRPVEAGISAHEASDSLLNVAVPVRQDDEGDVEDGRGRQEAGGPSADLGTADPLGEVEVEVDGQEDEGNCGATAFAEHVDRLPQPPLNDWVRENGAQPPEAGDEVDEEGGDLRRDGNHFRAFNQGAFDTLCNLFTFWDVRERRTSRFEFRDKIQD